MEKPQVSWWLAHSYVGVPTLAGTFVLGLVLLVFRDLDADLRGRLIPALVVYVLGLSLLAFVYFDLDARNCARARKKKPEELAREQAGAQGNVTDAVPGPQPSWIFTVYVAAHITWLIMLVGYLCCNGVL